MPTYPIYCTNCKHDPPEVLGYQTVPDGVPPSPPEMLGTPHCNGCLTPEQIQKALYGKKVK